MVSSRRAPRSEAGVTLLEVLVTISIMGIAFTALLAALMGVFTNGDTHRKLAVAETLLRRYADSIENAAYVNCAAPADYASALTGSPSPPTGYTVAIAPPVKYWDGAVSPAAFGSSQSNCVANGDKGIQQLTLRVTQTDTVRGVVKDLVVTKRDQ
jgi:prepilin-type N-terminal cleavage/methylation domain-containing protein